MNPPAAVPPTHLSLQDAQCATCNHTNICGAHPLVTSDTAFVPTVPVCVHASASPNVRRVFWWNVLTIFYYSTRFLGLHRVWFNAYRSIPTARNSDLENALTSRRSCWTETLQKMNRVWTMIIMASSLVITLSVAFLQIDNILNYIYPCTFSILAFVVSSASLAASCVFIANRERLDRVEKFRQWEIASQHQNELSSVDFWACLALPLTSLAWSVGFCLMTIFSLVWIDQGAHTIPVHTSKVDLGFSITLMSAIVLCLAFQFYRVQNLLGK